MADINQLLEPITPNNTVNSINIYKIDYLPNVYVNPRKIKGRKYSDNTIQTNPKIGQLKIKQFVSPILKSYWGLVSKAVKIKNTISLNTENDKYMFVKNASKEDLKKIKYDNYFGIRVSDNNKTLYDFDRRIIYHDIQRDPDDNDVVIINRNNAEPMLDLSKYKNIFIDKNTYKPIMSYYIKEYYDDDVPEFIGKQQDGVTGSLILPNNITNRDVTLTNSDVTDNTPKQLPESDSNVNQEETLSEKLSDSYGILPENDLVYDERTGELIYPERRALYKEQSKVEKDLKKTIIRYIDKYVNFAAANELNNIEDIDYIIDAFNEYTQDENLKINKRSIDAVNRRINKLYEINDKLDSMSKLIRPRYYYEEDSENEST